MSIEFDNISFNMPKTQSNAIKVIGVGGGGSNAVNHMYNEHIHGVDFVICNTDAQALENSPIPNKIQLGAHLTSGLGAGAKPEIGAQAATESIQDIQQLLSTHTKMVFITAGMGGGTGTGAAPIIAKVAKDMDILTVGIVTMPFVFEGKKRTQQAQKGIDELRKNVDSLIVVNNNKLREVYGNLGYNAGFSKADEVLSTAAKGIAEVITHHYTQNIDLHDAKTVLANSGTAIMGAATESGTNRAKDAIVKALDSPLLNDNKITGAKNVLLLIVSGTDEVTLDEIGEINDYIQEEAGYDANIIMGIGADETLEDGISLTVVATGFAADQQNVITNSEEKKVVHTLESEQQATYNFDENKTVVKASTLEEPLSSKPEEKIVHVLDIEEEIVFEKKEDLTTTAEVVKADSNEVINEEAQEEAFVITDITPKEKVEEQQPIANQELLFNSPLALQEEATTVSKNITEETSEKVENIEAEAPIIEKRYVLSDFDAVPTIHKSSTPKIKHQEVDENLQFEVRKKTKEEVKKIETIDEEVSPLSLTISELKNKTQERRRKMKQFNYRFENQRSKNIEKIEQEPTYKRLGIDIDVNTEISKEKTVLSSKEEESPLKSNNRFLHDNVD